METVTFGGVIGLLLMVLVLVVVVGIFCDHKAGR